jgi:serine/threonine protein kinase
VRAVAGRDPTELIGETLLDRYRVDRLIGKGGMAIVYAGRHTAIDRAVAIKVLRRRYADEPDTVARFLREARASSLVRHEHIVEVTDFGTTEDGLVFMVMEYLEGETLAEVLQREGRMPWSRVHGIALQLCEALHAAHRAGVVHRDITLRNCVRIRRRANREYIKLTSASRSCSAR